MKTKFKLGKKSSASKRLAEKPPAKKPPLKLKPVGPFGKAFLQNLKKAPLGTSVDVLIMETLRSMPADQLKAALAKATPKERALLFSAIPSGQIKSLIGSLPTSVLAPAQPLAPAPSPTNGPPASILTTTYENVAYPPAQNDPNWAEKITGGNTISDFPYQAFEWTPVYDPRFEKEGSLNNPMVGLTGWVVIPPPPPSNPMDDPRFSKNDVWFVHPFGLDFEFYIVPDPQYEGLLAASNDGVTLDDEFSEATGVARKIGLSAPKGVLGVETDQGLIPQSFRDLIKDGARIATFGRWIVDSGHDDFHTEIHAPLLMAVATLAPPPAGVQGASEMTSVQIMSRPYTVSQKFAEGNFVNHLLAEVAKVETTIFGFPLSWRVEAHPTVFTTPYDGRPYIKLLVQPPPRERVFPSQRLMVSFHFTHRTGVAVQVFDAGNGTVGIIIVLGDLNPASLPPKHDLTVQWDQLGSEYSYVIDFLQIADLLLGKELSALVLNRGILTDIYDFPSASSPLDNQNVAAPVDVNQVQPWVGLSEDNTQPFPIYGWLNVWWLTTPSQRPYAFVKGSDGQLWLNWWDGAAWYWSNQGTPPAVKISASVGVLTVMDSPNAAQRPYAFVKGSDGQLWLNWWDGAAWYWSNQGTPPAVKISASVGVLTVMDSPNAAQRPYAFVKGSDGQLWLNWWDGAAWYWSNQGTPPAVKISASVGVLTVMDSPNAAQRPYAFVKGSDGQLWLNWWDGAAWYWSNQGTPPAVKISASVGVLTVMDSPNAAQRPYAFVKGSDGQLWLNWWDGAAWYWSNQGTPPAVKISASVGVLTVMDSPNAAQRPYAFVKGSDGQLWLNWWDGAAWYWSNQGTPPAVKISASVGVLTVMDSPNAAQRPYAFVKGSDGQLWLNWWDGAAWYWSNQGTPPAVKISASVGVLTEWA